MVCFSTIHLLDKDGGMLLTSCGNSLSKKVILVCTNLFIWCNASLIKLCARHWNDSTASGFSWGVVFRGVSGTNETISFLVLRNNPLRKHIKSFGTLCRIMVGLSGNKLLRTMEKALDLAYQDVLNEFDSVMGVKGLIETRSNLVVTWKVRPQTDTTSWFPLRLRWFSQGGSCWFLFAIEFSICAKKKKKILAWYGYLMIYIFSTPFIFTYHSNLHTIHKPFNLGKIALVSIWFKMVLTQSISRAHKAFLTLRYPSNINIWLALELEDPQIHTSDTIIDVEYLYPGIHLYLYRSNIDAHHVQF